MTLEFGDLALNGRDLNCLKREVESALAARTFEKSASDLECALLLQDRPLSELRLIFPSRGELKLYLGIPLLSERDERILVLGRGRRRRCSPADGHGRRSERDWGIYWSQSEGFDLGPFGSVVGLELGQKTALQGVG